MAFQRYLSSTLWRKCPKKIVQVSTRLRRPLAIQADLTESHPRLDYTVCQGDVTEQSSEDKLKIFTILKKDTESTLCSAIPSKFSRLSRIIKEHSIMLRRPAFELLESIENPDDVPQRIILSGGSGSGKTLTMLHVLYYCSKKDWLILHVPHGDRFAESKTKAHDTQQSLWNVSRVDQPVESTKWLNQFRTMNMKHLNEIPLQNHYKWGKREETKKGSPLMSVVEKGIGRSLYSSDAVGVVLKEIQLNKSIKVLYAVDAFNGFYGNTTLRLNGKLVDRENLSLIHHFTKLLKEKHSLTMGCYIMAMSHGTHNAEVLGSSKATLLPEYCRICDQTLITSKALEDLGAYREIEIPNYNEEEFRAMLAFYQDKRWLAKDLTENAINQIRFITNRNPAQLREICTSLSHVTKARRRREF